MIIGYYNMKTVGCKPCLKVCIRFCYMLPLAKRGAMVYADIHRKGKTNMLIENANVFTGCSFRMGLRILVRDGNVLEVGEATGADEQTIDLNGDYLLPGFVDVHIHGFHGFDTMRGEEDIRGMSRALARSGVAAFCPTTMSASTADTERAVSSVRRVMNRQENTGARVLGAHMEAPFLNKAKAGAQRTEYFLLPDIGLLRQMTGNDLAAVRLLTLAPELEGSEKLIREAIRNGIRVSVGHTDADAETVHAAGDYGADHITHTFNAQRPIDRRDAGVPGAALTDDRFFCEMICDGIHLHQDIVRLLIRCKGAEHSVAITDAMEAAGLPDGEYSLGGQAVSVRQGSARLRDGTLAGSVLTMPRALSNLIHLFHTDPACACAMCTSTPAASVGERYAGYLIPGSPAIMTRWSPDWLMKSVITPSGECCQLDERML